MAFDLINDGRYGVSDLVGHPNRPSLTITAIQRDALTTNARIDVKNFLPPLVEPDGSFGYTHPYALIVFRGAPGQIDSNFTTLLPANIQLDSVLSAQERSAGNQLMNTYFGADYQYRDPRTLQIVNVAGLANNPIANGDTLRDALLLILNYLQHSELR